MISILGNHAKITFGFGELVMILQNPTDFCGHRKYIYSILSDIEY